MKNNIVKIVASAGAMLACGSPMLGHAQEVLPRPEQPFGGFISRKAKDSIKEFPKEVTAPKGAPNVLLILTDDVGFGASSTFGGPIPTATMDRLAKNGLRYNNFHTTALSSPTRAALLSGRNHHSAATGVIMELGIGRLRRELSQVAGASLFLQSAQDIRVGGRQSNAQYQYTVQSDNLADVYTWVPKITASLQQIPDVTDVNSDQQQNGWNTAWYGKNHNVPDWHGSQAGPYSVCFHSAVIQPSCSSLCNAG